MKITIETIEHSAQRYPTVGDWQFDDAGNLLIRVSQLSDWRREALVAVHELCEALLCKHQNVLEGAVDRFDMAYEQTRPEADDSEPGDHEEAPYRNQHCFATGIERLLCAEFGVSWSNYERELALLP